VVISKKGFRRYWRPKGLKASQQKSKFLFFRISLIFSSTCGHNFGRTVARKSSIGGFVFVQGG